MSVKESYNYYLRYFSWLSEIKRLISSLIVGKPFPSLSFIKFEVSVVYERQGWQVEITVSSVFLYISLYALIHGYYEINVFVRVMYCKIYNFFWWYMRTEKFTLIILLRFSVVSYVWVSHIGFYFDFMKRRLVTYLNPYWIPHLRPPWVIKYEDNRGAVVLCVFVVGEGEFFCFHL